MLIIVLVIVLVLGGGAAGGIAFYITHLPQPTLSATSDYKVGSTLAGANTTTFHLSGHKFSSTSAITFLLDNAPAPGSSATQSDSNGNVTATLTVTDGWTVGNHIITAKDAGGYATKAGVSITIVTPGQAKTPGPHGAPTDSASGTIAASIQTSGGSDTVVLNITGSDNGGTVCTDEADGKPHVKTGTSQGVSFVETISSTCSGTYKGGTLTYTETVNSDRIVFTDGIICTLQTPVVARHLEGTFTSATAINGSYSDDGGVITCKLGLVSKNSNVPSSKGTWSGTFKAK